MVIWVCRHWEFWIEEWRGGRLFWVFFVKGWWERQYYYWVKVLVKTIKDRWMYVWYWDYQWFLGDLHIWSCNYVYSFFYKGRGLCIFRGRLWSCFLCRILFRCRCFWRLNLIYLRFCCDCFILMLFLYFLRYPR